MDLGAVRGGAGWSPQTWKRFKCTADFPENAHPEKGMHFPSRSSPAGRYNRPSWASRTPSRKKPTPPVHPDATAGGPVQKLLAKIRQLPKAPGVYLFKDAQGVVLYVGKAKDLRSRVSSYFQNSADLMRSRGPDIVKMIGETVDVDFLDCETEVDALLLENRLIKDIQPPHNERQRDDKSFPYLEITTSDDFPGVYVTRKPRIKGQPNCSARS